MKSNRCNPLKLLRGLTFLCKQTLHGMFQDLMKASFTGWVAAVVSLNMVPLLFTVGTGEDVALYIFGVPCAICDMLALMTVSGHLYQFLHNSTWSERLLAVKTTGPRRFMKLSCVALGCVVAYGIVLRSHANNIGGGNIFHYTGAANAFQVVSLFLADVAYVVLVVGALGIGGLLGLMEVGGGVVKFFGQLNQAVHRRAKRVCRKGTAAARLARWNALREARQSAAA